MISVVAIVCLFGFFGLVYLFQLNRSGNNDIKSKEKSFRLSNLKFIKDLKMLPMQDINFSQKNHQLHLLHPVRSPDRAKYAQN